MTTWKQSLQPKGAGLTEIGAPMRSIAPPPRNQTPMLVGSTRAQKRPSETPAGRVVRITRGPSYTHDPRIQCAPGEQPFGAGFAAAGPGVDIETGMAWR